MQEITNRQLSSLVKSLYCDGSFIRRVIQSLRPYICPFNILIQKIHEPSRIFDIGCGSGAFLGILTEYGKVSCGVGVDPDTQAISSAQQMTKQLSASDVDLNFRVASTTDEWPTEQYDVVTMIDVLHHIPVPLQESFFKEGVKRVRHGGIFMYKDMCVQPKWRAYANQLHDLIMTHQWINHIPIHTADKWAKEKGLVILERNNSSLFWYGHELRVFYKNDPAHQMQTNTFPTNDSE